MLPTEDAETVAYHLTLEDRCALPRRRPRLVHSREKADHGGEASRGRLVGFILGAQQRKDSSSDVGGHHSRLRCLCDSIDPVVLAHELQNPLCRRDALWARSGADVFELETRTVQKDCD